MVLLPHLVLGSLPVAPRHPLLGLAVDLLHLRPRFLGGSLLRLDGRTQVVARAAPIAAQAAQASSQRRVVTALAPALWRAYARRRRPRW